MDETRDPVPRQANLHALTIRQLVKELAEKASLLARKEVALARAEVKEEIRTELRSASALGVAGVCALLTLQLLLVALVFGLTEAGLLHGWLWSLIVAGVVLAIGTAAGLIGWAKRVRTPLEATRRSVRENVRWAKQARERIA